MLWRRQIPRTDRRGAGGAASSTNHVATPAGGHLSGSHPAKLAVIGALLVQMKGSSAGATLGSSRRQAFVALGKEIA